MRGSLIQSISALQVFDSRGNPTVQATVTLEDGSKGVSIVPSGASTGRYEALELRDNNFREYNGKGVSKAIDNINKKIAKILVGEDALEQQLIDKKMIKLDNTSDKSKLGANSILAVSLAVAKAGAEHKKIPLYKYIGGISGNKIPTPYMNILNGGMHAGNNINIQEIMIVPVGASNFKEAMRMCVEVYQVLHEILRKKGLSTSVGDEGGFAPSIVLQENRKTKKENAGIDELAIKLVIEAIEQAGYKPGRDIQIALDVAGNEMREAAKQIEKEGYYFWKTDEYKTKDEMMQYIENLSARYPIKSIEDPLGEDDWKAWSDLTKKIGSKVQLVGDDLFVTNIKRLKKGIDENVANAILIKPNQIGTLTETLEAVKLARQHGYKTMISHRSGDTEDTFIADLAVAVNANQIKSGAPCRTERVSKYNRLLNIEEEIYD